MRRSPTAPPSRAELCVERAEHDNRKVRHTASRIGSPESVTFAAEIGEFILQHVCEQQTRRILANTLCRKSFQG